jgi:fumarate hydratase class II
MVDYRVQKDSLGEVMIPEDKEWGAQTQRSVENFRIGSEKMPLEMIYALTYIKKAAAKVHLGRDLLDESVGQAICQACDEILDGGWDDQFPLLVWQTGSGTQTNMNVNEVITRRGNIILGEDKIHPNDHVNMSQSSNDVFPSAMHMAALIGVNTKLLPSIKELEKSIKEKVEDYKDIIKIGRTHLQDATPLTLGQEISAWEEMMKQNYLAIEKAIEPLEQLALGGTAVGTGINAPQGFGQDMAEVLSEMLGIKLYDSENKFYQLTSKGGLVNSHGALKTLACDLMKIANDVRWLASGPRCGIGELSIPANEPGSSIMPGKVNPTQCEALIMVCTQVMGNDVTIGLAGSQGNFQLNVSMPVIIYNFLQSVNLLADAINSFNIRCLQGIKPVNHNIEKHLENSLMLVTALNQHLGYDKGAEIVELAHKENLTLREAAITLKLVSEEDFDRIVNPLEMVK